MTYTYKTHGTCSSKIQLELEGNIVKKVEFVKGCNGNAQGIAKLVEGMSVEEIKDKLTGISCEGRPTSCPDQLAKAVEEAYRNQLEQLKERK
ncbi:TIGR03905 family TSCPD domain-containing protein [Sinanaerobacter chloroacetimidivorans]|jgi:uncharacterized protein (TIGR03905 family)|uniref:ribonucleoside-diphosphate reductase n=1 Tax=Sinanaerobacter chloroacetimidivorans TaxID=2818044 RepID=A0A8J7VZT7_9FIRM|nr:TIGR03905 family TSCPD domain-containing protein [Sinanaerobacter chloroacetimidivorans]MBR0597741.1 TIGR03905 family TSCPD domain-containing protein [Sinanaerobacter chloroacetimidivorans]